MSGPPYAGLPQRAPGLLAAYGPYASKSGQAILVEPELIQEGAGRRESSRAVPTAWRTSIAGCLTVSLLLAVATAAWQRLLSQLLPLQRAAVEREVFLARTARFQKLSNGSCDSAGMLSILDSAHCEGAAEELNLSGTIVSPTNLLNRPEGCYYFINNTDDTETLWFGTNPKSNGKGAETSDYTKGWIRQPICEKRMSVAKQEKPSTTEKLTEASSTRSSSSPTPTSSAAQTVKSTTAATTTMRAAPTTRATTRTVARPTAAAGLAPKAVPTAAPTAPAKAAPSADPMTPGDVAPPMTMEGFVQRMKSSFSSPQDAFSTFDTRGDGCADRDEFVATVQSLAEPLNTEEANIVFGGFDTNQDGQLCSDEFLDSLKVGHFHQGTEEPGGSGWSHSSSSQTSSSPAPQEPAASSVVHTTVAPAPQEPAASSVVHTTLIPAPQVPAASSVSQAASVPGPQELGASSASQPDPGLAPQEPGAPSMGQTGGGPATQAGLSLAAFKRRMGSGTTPRFVFASLDTSADGYLVFSEILEGAAAFTPALTREEAASAFVGLDADRNNKVELSEFMAALQLGRFFGGTPTQKKKKAPGSGPAHGLAPAQGVITVAELRRRMRSTTPQEAFLVLDSDHDGFVSVTEFMGGRTAFTPSLTTEEASYVFRGLDVDHDHQVCSIEFDAVLKTGQFFQTPKELRARGAPPTAPPQAVLGAPVVPGPLAPGGHPADG